MQPYSSSSVETLIKVLETIMIEAIIQIMFRIPTELLNACWVRIDE